MQTLTWFRHDLRVDDNESFFHSLESNKNLLIYIFDENIWTDQTSSSFHLKFTIDSLDDLNKQLMIKYNAHLNIYYGDTLEILKHLIKKYNVTHVNSNRIFRGLLTNKIDDSCKNLFNENSIEWKIFNQFGIQLSKRNRSTWSTDWRKFMSRKIQNHSDVKCKFISDSIMTDYKIKTNTIASSDIQSGGSRQAKKLLDSFISYRGTEYQSQMSSPLTADTSCSRLSPSIALGTISIRTIYQTTLNKLKTDINTSHKKSLKSFKSRLAWHCHFIQKLYDQPSIENSNLNPAYNGMRENSFDEKKYQAWTDGETGYPFVDACMRYLKETGWINFRMRAMLVSFASYQLWLDWKITSKYLARYFTDYEPGIHYSQFQMQSGTTGINTIRIYNPIKQSMDHDKYGHFIKKWVPEISALPDAYIHQPWLLTPIEMKSTDFKFGQRYPHRIVENTTSTQLAKEKIWGIKTSKTAKEISKDIVKKHASNKLSIR